MSWYPGAFVHDYGGTGNCNPDSVVLHEVVNDIPIPADGSPSNIAGWVSGSLACQFYVDYAGSAEQFCTSTRGSSHCKDGNNHRLGIETQDNKPQNSEESNAGSWRAAQRERLADIAAWIALIHGMPIRQMQTSRRSDIGIGYHRLGVPSIGGGWDGWRDGEVWTNAPGKPCPGDGRIAQVPGIVARAGDIAAAVNAGRCGFLPPGPIDLNAAYARTGGSPASSDDPESWLTVGAKDDIIAEIKYGNDKIMEGGKGDPNFNIQDTYVRLGWVQTQIAALEARLFNRAPGSQSIVDEVQWAAKNVVPGSRLTIVIDDSTGAWYALGPNVFWHLPNFDFVNVGRAAGLLDEETHHVNADGIILVRMMALSNNQEIYAPPATYTVVKGDTLTIIAGSHQVTVAQLREWNALTDPNALTVGQVLKVTA